MPSRREPTAESFSRSSRTAEHSRIAASNHPDLVGVGTLVAAHGVRGWARIRPYHADSEVLGVCPSLWLRRSEDAEPKRFGVHLWRPHKRVFLVGLDGITDRDAVTPWIGCEVAVERETIPPAGEGEVYDFEVIGLEVRTVRGEAIGVIREVQPLPAGDLWVVETTGKSPAREVLVPVAGAIAKEIDLVERIATIDPPASLLEEE